MNIWRMGKNGIDKGNRDNWTMLPKRLDWLQAELAKEQRGASGEGRQSGVVAMDQYEKLLKPEWRDARGYILSANQPDFNTAIKFTRVLQSTGIVAHRATGPFEAAGKKYPAGSIVFKSAQAFRPHLLDLFEPQNYPNEFRYPGGPPIPPYDSAGWTLAYQMGVKFDRVLDAFEGPFERLRGPAPFPEGRIDGTGTAGFQLSHRTNDSFKAINKLLALGEDVYWLKDADGTIFIPAKATTRKNMEAAAAEANVAARAVATKPAGEALKLKPLRIGLWDTVGGSMSSGWTRWLMEQFQFPFEVVYPPALDQGDLRAKFDVLVFVTGAIGGGGRGGFVSSATPSANLLPEWQARSGRVTREKTLPHLKKFLESGGSILTIGSSTALAEMLGLPLANHMMERLSSGQERPLSNDKYYVPGSVMEVAIDNTNPLAYGMEKSADVFFDNSPVFRLKPEAALQNVKPVAWFNSKEPLRSGWAWGQHYLEGGVAIAESKVGEGKVFLFGPEVIFRAQPHGTFKLFFNALYYGAAENVKF